jgi:DNA polymerase III subunit epsilon
MYVVLDFETTGLDYKTEQVIEVGAIRLDHDFKELGTLHLMVKLKKGKELPPFITELTGITKDDLRNGISEFNAMQILHRFIGNDIVVAQFASFDLGFLSKYMQPKKFICTRSMSRLLNPKEKASLKDLVQRYGVELKNHHRALDDVTATAEVFKIMKREADERGIEYLNVMVNANDRPLRYIPENAKVINITLD